MADLAERRKAALSAADTNEYHRGINHGKKIALRQLRDSVEASLAQVDS